jgi:hypothetical protein
MRCWKFCSVIAFFIALFLVGAVGSAHAMWSYLDVPDDYWAKEEIEYLSSRNVISGYPDGTFKPQNSLKRVHVALMIDREKGYSYEEFKDQGLTDISKNDPNYDAINAVVSKGLFDELIKNNKFEPYKTVTRAEMASILAKAFELKPKTDGKITDVPKNHWAYPYVQALVDHHITILYEGDNFKPNNPLTRAQFAAFMSRAIHDYFKPIPKEVHGKEVLFWSNWDGIYKTAVDTNETVAVHPKAAYEKMYRKDGWIYFMEETIRTDHIGEVVKGYIYRMKEDGSQKQRLSDDIVTTFAVVDNKIVYSYYGTYDHHHEYGGIINEDTMKIKSMNLDGSNPKVIQDNVRSFRMVANDEWVFYEDDDGGIYRMRADGSGKLKLSDHIIDYYEGFLTVTNDKIIYSTFETFEDEDWEYTVYVMNTDGTNRQKIADDIYVYVRDVVGNHLIYTLYDPEKDVFVLYKSNLDLSNSIKLAEFNNGMYVGAAGGKLWVYNYNTDKLEGYSY